jgi:hypothetical protein
MLNMDSTYSYEARIVAGEARPKAIALLKIGRHTLV